LFEKKLKNTSFFDSSHWLQSTEGSSMVDCSIAMMLAIEKISI